MKKIAITFLMLLVLSIYAFADDGQTPAGGKSCPNGQTCFVSTPEPPITPTNGTIFKTVFDFLKSIFG